MPLPNDALGHDVELSVECRLLEALAPGPVARHQASALQDQVRWFEFAVSHANTGEVPLADAGLHGIGKCLREAIQLRPLDGQARSHGVASELHHEARKTRGDIIEGVAYVEPRNRAGGSPQFARRDRARVGEGDDGTVVAFPHAPGDDTDDALMPRSIVEADGATVVGAGFIH